MARFGLVLGAITGSAVFALATLGHLRGPPIPVCQTLGIVLIITVIGIWAATRRRRQTGRDSWYISLPTDPDYFYEAVAALEKELRDRRYDFHPEPSSYGHVWVDERTGEPCGRQYRITLPPGSALTLRFLIRDVGRSSQRDCVLEIPNIESGNSPQARQIAAELKRPLKQKGLDPDMYTGER
ncbi:MAG: hypothetical protein QXH42_04110 [Thermoplasmata archaeon]